MSLVRTPLSIAILVASSIFAAYSGRQREYLNIMLIDRIVATGLTMPCPAISGAEPVARSAVGRVSVQYWPTVDGLVDAVQLCLAIWDASETSAGE